MTESRDWDLVPTGSNWQRRGKKRTKRGVHVIIHALLRFATAFFFFFRYLFYLIWLFLWCDESFYKRRKTGRYLLYIRFNKKPNKKERDLATKKKQKYERKQKKKKTKKRERRKKNKFNLAHFIVSHLHGATLAASVNAPSGWT